MADILLYIKFKDTASDKNENSFKIAFENLAAQLITAADRVKQDRKAIFDYVRQDAPLIFDTVETPAEPPVPETIAPVNPVPTPTISNEDDMIRVVFTNMKRTRKSEAIIRYFVQNSGIDLTVDQIAAGSSLTKADLSVWLAQTGKRVPAIENTSRGVYKFNPNQLAKSLCPQVS